MHAAWIGTCPVPAPITRCHDATSATCALFVEIKVVTEEYCRWEVGDGLAVLCLSSGCTGGRALA